MMFLLLCQLVLCYCYGCLSTVYNLLRDLECRLGTSIVIVVSPLVSLMTDQVARFSKMGVSAGMLSVDISKDEARKIVEGHY